MRRMFNGLAIIISIIGVIVVVSSGSVKPAMAAAATTTPVTQFALTCATSSFFGFAPWYACLPIGTDGGIDITDLNQFWLIVFPLLEDAIKVAAYVAVGLIIWGAIKYIKSQGNPSNINSARDTIRDAIIGLIICIVSVGAVEFFVTLLPGLSGAK